MSKHSHNHGNAGEETEKPSGKPSGKPEEKPPEEQVENGEKAPEGQVSEIPAAKAGTPEAEAAEQTSKIADLQAKLAELNDQYLRKAADFDNFRKRMIREKQELTEFANQNLLLDILPMIDDFERAIKSAETSKDFASFYEGIVMIEKRLSTELENKWGLKRFDSIGEPFDPNRHEAIQMEKAAGIAEAVVKEDFLKGYLLKERVIRFAKVKVLMPDGENSASSGGEARRAGDAPADAAPSAPAGGAGGEARGSEEQSTKNK